MPRPDVTAVSEQVHAALGPWGRRDALTENWELLRYVEAMVADLQEVEDLSRDSDNGPGWSAVLDLNRAPTSWLPWLGQFSGVGVNPLLSAEEQRAQILVGSGQRRGTVESMRMAAQQTLVGTRQVTFFERYLGSAYRLRIQTLTEETPDSSATLAALMATKPGGIVLEYAAVDGRTYLDVVTEFASYADLDAKTYLEVREGD